MNIKNMLEDKWEPFKKENHHYSQCDLGFISKDARLNLLFEPIDCEEIINQIGIQLPNDIKVFFKQTNGCRLFSNSLNIYGLQKYTNELFEPYDIVIENNKIQQESGGSLVHYIFIGSLGGRYIAGFKRNDSTYGVYCFSTSSWELVKRYVSFDSFFTTLFNNLYNEYTINGHKIHKLDRYANVKVLHNMSFEEKYMEVSRKC
jgi:hypothetical protein